MKVEKKDSKATLWRSATLFSSTETIASKSKQKGLLLCFRRPSKDPRLAYHDAQCSMGPMLASIKYIIIFSEICRKIHNHRAKVVMPEKGSSMSKSAVVHKKDCDDVQMGTHIAHLLRTTACSSNLLLSLFQLWSAWRRHRTVLLIPPSASLLPLLQAQASLQRASSGEVSTTESEQAVQHSLILLVIQWEALSHPVAAVC